jgi:hypothetical protein
MHRSRRRPPSEWAHRAHARSGYGRRHRLGTADIAFDVATAQVPHNNVMTRVAQPGGDFASDPGCAAGHHGAHAGGPINSTSTPSGAVMTAIGTVLPTGAGTLMRRTPSSKPRAASAEECHVDLTLRGQQKESVPRCRRCSRRVLGTL